MQRRIEDMNVQSTEPDQTIEILMTELDPQIMSIFTKEESANAKDATEVRKVHKNVVVVENKKKIQILFFSLHSDLAFIRFYREW